MGPLCTPPPGRPAGPTEPVLTWKLRLQAPPVPPVFSSVILELHHLGHCYGCKFPDPTPDLPAQKLCVWGPATCILTSSPGGSGAY